MEFYERGKEQAKTRTNSLAPTCLFYLTDFLNQRLVGFIQASEILNVTSILASQLAYLLSLLVDILKPALKNFQ